MKHFRFAPASASRSDRGPLGHWVNDFVDVLSTRGYATSTMRRYVRAAAIAWLARQRVVATDIDEALVTRFVTGLPRRPSATRLSGRLSDVAGGVRLLAVHLWTRNMAVRRRFPASARHDDRSTT